MNKWTFFAILSLVTLLASWNWGWISQHTVGMQGNTYWPIMIHFTSVIRCPWWVSMIHKGGKFIPLAPWISDFYFFFCLDGPLSECCRCHLMQVSLSRQVELHRCTHVTFPTLHIYQLHPINFVDHLNCKKRPPLPLPVIATAALRQYHCMFFRPHRHPTPAFSDEVGAWMPST